MQSDIVLPTTRKQHGDSCTGDSDGAFCVCLAGIAMIKSETRYADNEQAFSAEDDKTVPLASQPSQSDHVSVCRTRTCDAMRMQCYRQSSVTVFVPVDRLDPDAIAKALDQDYSLMQP